MLLIILREKEDAILCLQKTETCAWAICDAMRVWLMSSLSAYTSGYLQGRWHITSVKTQVQVVTITVLQQNIGDELIGYMHAGFNKF